MMAKMKLKVIIAMVTAAIVLSIVGCSSETQIRNRSSDYLYSEEVPAMEVSGDKDDTAVGELYAMQNKATKVFSKKKSLLHLRCFVAPFFGPFPHFQPRDEAHNHRFLGRRRDGQCRAVLQP